MKKIIAVFAHPDDEALGPAGTLAKFADTNHVVSIICVTNGDAAGKTNLEKETIGEIRKAELQNSAKILGIKEVFFLEYPDGELRNNIYHELAGQIQEIVERIRPDILLTFEPRGVSGHIDHMAVSMITSFIYCKLSFVKKLMYYCLGESRQQLKDYFIYFPPCYKKEDVDETIDVTEYWDIKVQAMHAHQSQIEDVKRVLDQTRHLPKEECFMTLEK